MVMVIYNRLVRHDSLVILGMRNDLGRGGFIAGCVPWCTRILARDTVLIRVENLKEGMEGHREYFAIL